MGSVWCCGEWSNRFHYMYTDLLRHASGFYEPERNQRIRSALEILVAVFMADRQRLKQTDEDAPAANASTILKQNDAGYINKQECFIDIIGCFFSVMGIM